MAEAGVVLTSEVVKKYDPGSITVSTDQFRVVVEELTISGTNEVVVEGTGTILVI